MLVVHQSGSTRALLTELLTQAGFRVEALVSPYHAIARVVDEPADLVLLGLAGVKEAELGLIAALKREEVPPRVLLTFPSPLRDRAVRALAQGADGYVLEPFYGDELVGAVRGQMALQERPEPTDALAQLAREVAHAVGNPLQVLALLMQKERVTKKELLAGIPEHVARIEAVVGHLREFGAVGAAKPQARDVRPLVERAAADAGVGYDAQEVPLALVDEGQYAEALRTLMEAVGARTGEEALSVQLVAEKDAVALRLLVPRRAFRDQKPAELLDAVFVVQPDREVAAGFARVRLLLEKQRGSLAIEQKGERLLFVARVPLA
ncbi:MAG: response regulator transcription factor [Planctomycetota bacterium]